MSPRPHRKYSQAARIHDVIRLIEARRGVALDDLVQECGVNRRTIHRDLVAIEDAGYPLIAEWQGNRKLYSFITGFKDIPPVSFTLSELMTLSLLRSQLEFLKGTPFHEDMAAISRKVSLRFFLFKARAIPQATPRPCPRDPFMVSNPGMTESGMPPRMEPSLQTLSRFSFGKNPRSAKTG